MHPPEQMLSPSQVTDHCHAFLSDCARSIDLCAETPVLADIAKRLRSQVATKKPKPFDANPLPALANLSLVKDMALAKRFQMFAPGLPWDYSPRTSDEGTELAVCDFGKVLDMDGLDVGVIYVDCHREYPLHNHPPHELYFLVSGTAKWRYGQHLDYESLTAGNLIHNEPNDWHGVIAGHTPVLALYAQWC
ncbi:MAG: hypothetical protein GKR96_05400 [Gammaproteobacteria bacterium]|nr:hypothetical protein [Gammaproteobacteria bacterium]